MSKGEIGLNNALKNGRPPFRNEQSLRSAIESICAEFGSVTFLEILPAKLGPDLQCACFLRLESVAAQNRLRSKHNLVEIDAKVAFLADVDESWTGPRM